MIIAKNGQCSYLPSDQGAAAVGWSRCRRFPAVEPGGAVREEPLRVPRVCFPQDLSRLGLVPEPFVQEREYSLRARLLLRLPLGVPIGFPFRESSCCLLPAPRQGAGWFLEHSRQI